MRHNLPMKYLVTTCALVAAISATSPAANGKADSATLKRAGEIPLAVVADKVALAHTAQLLPLNEKGELVGKGDIEKQIAQTFQNISQALKAAGADLETAVKINVYAATETAVSEVQMAVVKKWNKKPAPAVSFVVGTLDNTNALVAMDAIAPARKFNEAKTKRIQVSALRGQVSGAQVSILPKGGVVYISGQAKPGELADATRQTMQSLGDTLTFLGLGKRDVVQIKAFIDPMAGTAVARKQIADFFQGETAPPVVFVDWISPKLPIEIELIAAAPENRAAGESISYITPPGFQVSNVYSKVARVNYGKLVYVSGLYGKTPGNAEQQVLEIFASLRQAAQETGSNFDSLAKATYYVSDSAASNKLNELRPKFYNPNRPPAASKALTRSVGFPGMAVTMDMIAVSEK